MRHFFLLALLLPVFCFGQEEQKYEQIRFVNLGFENDLFQLKNQSDKFFSAGFFYELAHPVFDFKLSRKLLLGFKDAPINEFGIRINHLGFTPSKIDLPEIDTTDRPFAGLLYADLYRVSSNYQKGLRLQSTFKLGIMGPAAGMQWVQETIHELTGSTPPMGWETQVGNALVLDYKTRIAKKLPIHSSFFESRLAAEVELGSIWNYVGVGMEFQFGYYNNWMVNRAGIKNRRQSPLETGENGKKSFSLGNIHREFQFYLYVNPTWSYIIYDGTISGGLIPFEDSPHTLSNSDLVQWLFLIDSGIVIQYKSFGFRYKRSIRSDRFALNDIFSFGQFDIIVAF